MISLGESINAAGGHIDAMAINMSRERVHRAQIAQEMIDRYAPDLVMSPTAVAS